MSSGLCLINLILWSYTRIGYIDSNMIEPYLKNADYVLQCN